MGLDRTAGDAVVRTGPDGSFVIPAMASGKLTIGTQVDPALPVRPRIPVDLNVPFGRTTRVDIPLEKAVRVQGVIRVKGSGDPVAGRLDLDRLRGAAPERFGGERRPGTVHGARLAGDVTMHVIFMPESFVQLGEPWAERYRVPEAAETFDLPPIEVVRGITIKGRLVDAKDRPVADVGINAVSGNRRYGFGRTDQSGSFTLSQVPAGLELRYEFWRNDHEGPIDAEIFEREPLLLRAGTTTRPAQATRRPAAFAGK